MINHDYVISLRRFRQEEGRGYIATIPQLGIDIFYGTGGTPEDALRHLAETYVFWHSRWLEDGREEDLFPPPTDERRICWMES